MEVTAPTVRRCTGCGAALLADDCFCEQCGARTLARLGANPSGDDRIETDLVLAAAISDRGRVHRRNEDAFRIEVVGKHAAIAVVCDGISSASAGDAAARSAAHAAAAALSEAAAGFPCDGRAAVLEAVQAAQAAVVEVPWTTRTDRDVPACTLVCALWQNRELIVASVGDSRAYWSDESGTCQLTIDDSWAEQQVVEGRLSMDEAMRDPRSHSITHWIGADAPDRPPRVVTRRSDRPGRILLCSDGLWNYATTNAALHELIDALPSEASAAAVARSLVDTALHRGGRDNITIAVIDVNPS